MSSSAFASSVRTQRRRRITALPIAEFFDVMVDPEDCASVLCLVGQPIPPGAKLWYGYGLNPYCNLTDDEDMGVLAFGPMEIQPKP